MTEHDTLPLPDYDQLPIEGLTHRIRMLDTEGVQTLLEYERAHGNRANAVTILENRLSALREGAQPSGGDPRPADEPAVPRRPEQPRPAPPDRVAAKEPGAGVERSGGSAADGGRAT